MLSLFTTMNQHTSTWPLSKILLNGIQPAQTLHLAKPTENTKWLTSSAKLVDFNLIWSLLGLALYSERERGLERRLCRINKERDLTALNRQGTQQQTWISYGNPPSSPQPPTPRHAVTLAAVVSLACWALLSPFVSWLWFNHSDVTHEPQFNLRSDFSGSKMAKKTPPPPQRKKKKMWPTRLLSDNFHVFCFVRGLHAMKFTDIIVH